MDLQILQWNAQGLTNKTAQLTEALITGNIHIAIIQETLYKENSIINIPGYQTHKTPWGGGNRGLVTLIKTDIPHTRIQQPVPCGEGTEHLGVQVHLGENTVPIYNIYCNPNHGELDLTELFSEAEYQPIIVAGDFNAHHPFLQSSSRTNQAGHHLHNTIQDFPTMQLINDTAEPTHICGGRLDLTFTSSTLSTNYTWRIHDNLASDHFATVTTLTISCTIHVPPQPKGWNVKKADWARFDSEISKWWEEIRLQEEGTLDEHEQHLLQALNAAAESAIPPKKNGKHHRDWWFYNDKVKEMNARVNHHRRKLRRHRTQENLKQLREVIAHSREVSNQARTDQWYKWCTSFNQHTSLTELWNKLKTATGQRKNKVPAHPHPQREAERIMAEFANRASYNQLPPDIMTEQHRLRRQREETVEDACSLPDSTDTPFTPTELRQAQKRSSDTAPGRDGITYSMISQSGRAGAQAILALINHSWRLGKLPDAWKLADITPIPKPKERNKYRPIALTSCICKTMERMVKTRLIWKTGKLHQNIYGFTTGRGTTECIVELLSHIRDRKTHVVFLDIEKAFELANPQAILHILVKKGVTGRMLAWTRDYLTDRHARVTFQGHSSIDHALQNGTPQGGVLSPFLFNLLMEEIVSLKLPQFCTILSYADDLVLIVKGAKSLNRTQICLDRITEKCKILGLKLSHAKSKAMVVKGRNPDSHLTIQDSELEWVRSYLYLGVWIDQSLSFTKELDYVKDKTKSRLNAMWAMTNPKTGATQSILRLFYIQAIRTHVDYAAPVLVALSESKWKNLEPIQNRATRIMTGSPPWTPSPPLLIETNLVPLRTRIQERVTLLAIKIIHQGGDCMAGIMIKRKLNHSLTTASSRKKKWTEEFSKIIRRTVDQKMITAREHDRPHPNHNPRPPWENRTWEIIVRPSRLPKKHTSTPELQQIGREIVGMLVTEGTATYYTDGSVNSDNGLAGAAFVTQGTAYGWKISDHSSSTQTELAAIIQATRHAATRDEHTIVILTDSLTALQALQHDQPKDNIRLITTAVSLLDQLQQQGKQVKLAWIPSHVGIQGNEKADHAAKQAASQHGREQDTFKIPPSLQMICAKIRTTTRRKATEETANACNHWYKTATDLQPLTTDTSVSRRDRINLLRLRLGYRTKEEIILGQDTTICEHCGSDESDSLVHYLLDCPQTNRIRSLIRPPEGHSREVAAQYVKQLVKFPVTTSNFTKEVPPPR